VCVCVCVLLLVFLSFTKKKNMYNTIYQLTTKSNKYMYTSKPQNTNWCGQTTKPPQQLQMYPPESWKHLTGTAKGKSSKSTQRYNFPRKTSTKLNAILKRKQNNGRQGKCRGSRQNERRWLGPCGGVYYL